MAAATEIQVGTARINGIQGTITVSISTTPNLTTMGLADNFSVETIRSQNGAVIETKIAAARERVLTLELIPSSTTKAGALSDAIAIMAALTPLAVITIAGCSITTFNGTYNYESGGEIVQKRETYTIINIKASACEVAATAGTFAGLAVAT